MKWNSFLTEFLCDNDISDEGVYTIYRFLESLCLEFESQEFCRISRYCKAKEEEMNNATFIEDPPF
jgi:hypothetical protein